MGFAKFMLATPELLTESLEKDLQELVEEIDVLKSFGTDASGLHFVALAQQKVKDQMQKVRDELDLPHRPQHHRTGAQRPQGPQGGAIGAASTDRPESTSAQTHGAFADG